MKRVEGKMARDGEKPPRYRPRRPCDLGRLLEREYEVGHSLWDRTSLIAHVDIEYVHFDRPALGLLDADRAAEVGGPVVDALKPLLAGWGIASSCLLSGRGYHLVWRIRLNSDVFGSLATLGRVPASLLPTYEKPYPLANEPVGSTLCRAWAGLGMLIEYLGHRVIVGASERCPVPIKLTAIEVGPGLRGREIVSIDVSEYGEPFQLRSIRLPPGAYLKPWRQGPLSGAAMEPLVLLVQVPLHERDVMWGLDRAAVLAARASTQIADSTKGTGTLFAEYSRSPLALFHKRFYETCLQSDRRAACGDVPLPKLPPCVSHVLDHPNDLLLRPGRLELAVRTLLALGWESRSIAALIRSRCDEDHGWDRTWRRLDPAYRADFYTRLFAGLVAAGTDELVDFNCQSTREKGYCTYIGDCGFNLADFREVALQKTRHERLGRRVLRPEAGRGSTGRATSN